MGNTLDRGTVRVGQLFDGCADSPSVQVILEMTDRGIELGVPWAGIDDPYSGWFLREHGVVHRSSGFEDRRVPSCLTFQDSHGWVLLLGCRSGGFHANLMGPGQGRVHAERAILGVRHDVDFGSPHGLQSSISGLREWTDQSSWEERHKYTGESPLLEFSSIDQPDILIGNFNGMELSIRFDYGIERDGENTVLTDRARCLTRSESGAAWDDHVRLHRAVRDLIVLSRWHEESCLEEFVLHKSDPLRTLDGKTHGEQWREVILPQRHESGKAPSARQHIIEFGEVGGEGLRRWIDLRNKFARALDPVVSCKGLRQAPPQTLLAHTGPGLEALGYLLLLQDGHSERQAERKRLRDKLDRILVDVGTVLPFDAQVWANQFADNYNGLKHANRKAPDAIEVLNSWMQGVLVVRAWTALTLGVTPERLRDRLSKDPQSRAYVPMGQA